MKSKQTSELNKRVYKSNDIRTKSLLSQAAHDDECPCLYTNFKINSKLSDVK